MIDNHRVQTLNSRPTRDSAPFVLYWMQQAQRAACNHALEFALIQANRLRRPLLVAFVLLEDYPEANRRHYQFMIEGLRETSNSLARRRIAFTCEKGRPVEIISDLGRTAALIVCDRGYLRHQKEWRNAVAQRADCAVLQVESDVVVPVETASEKAELAARTLRPKINRQLKPFLKPLPETAVEQPLLSPPPGLNLSALQFLEAAPGDASVPPVSPFFRGGTSVARKLFATFLKDSLPAYASHRNQPQTNDVAHMSMYLHFGQISPLWLALQALEHRPSHPESVDVFLEELVVRRELSMNFVHYTRDYDSFSALPLWARKTLEDHAPDCRPHLYSEAHLESAGTHDTYWNAAMTEMKVTGYMHNYMRMYWGKKILEWSSSPSHAFSTALQLNNKYFLDGRDPVSFANVAWVFGLHDRPWPERPIYGKIRSMTAGGLERKCDIAAYLQKVKAMAGG